MVRWARENRLVRRTAAVSPEPAGRRRSQLAAVPACETKVAPSAAGKVLRFVSGWLKKTA
jgi:hypothetical protein